MFFAVLLIAAGLCWGLGTTLVRQVADLGQKGPEMLGHFIGNVIGDGITMFGHTWHTQDVLHMLYAAVGGLFGANMVGRLLEVGVGLIFGAFLTLVLIPYFMVSGPRLVAGTIGLLPPEHRHFAQVLVARLAPALRRYMFGVLMVVAYTSVIAWIGFYPVFHLPNALLLAVTVGIREMGPAAGPLTSAVLVGLTALEQNSMLETIGLIGFIIMLRLSIDNGVGPYLLGQAARVHPVVVMFSFVIGAVLFGIIGLLLAVPLAVVVRMVLEQYYAEPIAGARARRNLYY
jgi:predicted PurR-regulated permease PerM